MTFDATKEAHLLATSRASLGTRTCAHGKPGNVHGVHCADIAAALERAHAAGVVEGLRKAEGIAHDHRRMGDRPAAVYRVAAAEIQEAIATERVSLETGEK